MRFSVRTVQRLSSCCMLSRRCSSAIPIKLVEVNEIENGIFHVTLNRPEKMNALSVEMFEAIAETATSFKQNKQARVIILSGNGKAFCTGLDVKSVASNPMNFSKLLQKPAGTEITNIAQDVGYLWRQLQVPVIASLHGMCFGGGLQIAMGADFRFSTPDCKLSVMEAKWGLIPDMSASVTFREVVRLDVIKLLSMTARIFSGVEAQQYGFVTSCADDPYEAALSLAREICERSPDAVAATKKLFQTTYSTAPEREGLDLETTLQKKLLVSWNQNLLQPRVRHLTSILGGYRAVLKGVKVLEVIEVMEVCPVSELVDIWITLHAAADRNLSRMMQESPRSHESLFVVVKMQSVNKNFHVNKGYKSGDSGVVEEKRKAYIVIFDLEHSSTYRRCNFVRLMYHCYVGLSTFVRTGC